MKLFYYNTIVNREDFADREEDIEQLLISIKKGRKTVIYAPRRYGKTSLAQNILPQAFKSSQSAHLYADFMDCPNIESVAKRLLEAYSHTLKNDFKKTNLLKTAQNFLSNLTLLMTPDPMTGEISFAIQTKNGKTPDLSEILESIVKLCEQKKTLLIFDEFQDIHLIPEALAIFRSNFQKLKTTPILFLGSKRKLLSEIFVSRESPFFNFAEEHVLHPIKLEDWVPFFKERLDPLKIKIEKSALHRLCEEALQVPNAICEIGSFIQDHYSKQTITEELLMIILSNLIDKKSETYRYQLSLLSENELKVCKALSHQSFINNINSKKFLTVADMGASSATKSIRKLYHAGVIEEDTRGYRVSNPILSLFLKYRSY